MNKGKKEKVNPLVTGAAGAVVGASIGTVAGVAMNDTATRKKVERVVKSVQKQATGYVKSLDTEKGKEEGKKAVRTIAAKTMKMDKNASDRKSQSKMGSKTSGRRATAQA